MKLVVTGTSGRDAAAPPPRRAAARGGRPTRSGQNRAAAWGWRTRARSAAARSPARCRSAGSRSRWPRHGSGCRDRCSAGAASGGSPAPARCSSARCGSPALVGDVPHAQCRVTPVPLGHLLDQVQECSRYTSELGDHARRPPWCRTVPRRSTGSISGCAVVNQAGGDAVAVARSTAMPCSCRRSSTRSSQSKSQVSGIGCRRAGEDADRDEVDPRLLHQPDVLLPHVLGPLLGVVVPPNAMGPLRPSVGVRLWVPVGHRIQRCVVCTVVLTPRSGRGRPTDRERPRGRAR